MPKVSNQDLQNIVVSVACGTVMLLRNVVEHSKRGCKYTYALGTSSVQSVPLVDPQKIFLPPLYIKFGLMNKFVKEMIKVNSEGFQYLSKKFPKVSAAKLKEEIFIGPQIREVLIDMEI